MSSDEESLDLTPANITEEAQKANESTLPPKSRDKYLEEYEHFLQWKTEKNCSSFSEKVILAYFSELAAKYKPTTLWSKYSMLKSTICCKNDINIQEYSYHKLIAFLKRQSDGFRSKKSKVLSASDVEKFLNDAPDKKYLATKVALIFGITGACRREELANIHLDDIENHGETLLVKIPNTKTKISRSFTIYGQFYEIVKKYESLRSSKSKSQRFFQNFQNGKCLAQCIGINKFGGMPKEIATYLQLPEPESYTGHSFRRTSATLLADSGADLTTLKRHGGWKSNTVAENYIEDSFENKKNICSKITQSVNLTEHSPSNSDENIIPNKLRRPSTSFHSDWTEQQPSTSTGHTLTSESLSSTRKVQEVCNNNSNLSQTGQTIKLADKTCNFNFHSCTNITFNFNN